MERWTGKAMQYGGAAAIIGSLAFLMSGYGYQFGWWGLGVAFNYLLYYGGLLAFVGFVVTLVGLVAGRDTGVSRMLVVGIAGIVLGGATLVTLSYWANEAGKYPSIHDITTDTENPPQFEAIVPLRKDAPNKTEYGGPEIARIQQENYPDIKPLVLDMPYPKAFDQALQAAGETSWTIHSSDKQSGKIEATHTLAWYGFKDDIVIRVDTAATDSTHSVIDVRSVSRIGRGDIGVNAHRIKEYLSRVEKR